MTSIPLTCPACNGTGGTQTDWTGYGKVRCAACGGAGHFSMGVSGAPVHTSDVLSQLLDAREVSGCAECPLGTSTNDCIEGIDFPLWQCGHNGELRHGQAPIGAPDWCPLRKGPVTLRLKEGA